MSKEMLQNIIDGFNPEKFIRFFREKNRAFAPRQEELMQYNDEDFKNGLKLGEIKFSDIEQLAVCAFQASQPLSERSGKKAQYEKGKRILKNEQYDAGIFIFYDQQGNFRFSLIYANYLGKKRDWSTFRRFTYFVSKEFTNKTFLQRIGESEFSNLDKTKDVFSVEKVTDKFFDEFRIYFEKTKIEFERKNKNTVCLWLKDKYSEEEYREQINRFAYTFLGRIIFIYFLQRKGWIENQRDYLRKTIENKNNSNFYFSFLQPLFFDVFAKKENERPDEIKKQYKDTPYLNGGLFEKSELESNLEKAGFFVLFDDSFIKDLISNFFEAYNFTVDENSPDDQEVSIDPEMLGKVFENTLAEEERGKKGTFYTPREIVHFMVKESIWQFLKNETDIDTEELHSFVYGKKDLDNLDFSRSKDKVRIINAKLENIKVLDPAVGSAAFPVEMMQVLVDLRKKLNVNVGKNINEVVLKKQFIKNNLYGVDIDPGAIEIAKLRLWLALIVDYEKSEAEPLPNLDFQFRVGNSLQEKIGNIDIFKETEINKLQLEWNDSFNAIKQKMLSVKDKFYESENEEEKKKLKREFDEFEHKIILERIKDLQKQWRREASIGNAIGKKANELLKEINNLEQKIKDGTYKLFKPDFHFSEVFDRKDENGKKAGGFDIVIGNPPYGVRVDDDIKDWHGLGSPDSYGVFISTSLKRFLKPRGVLSFIVSDTWLTIKTHREIREQVLQKQLHKIIRVHKDCFDATVNACIMLLNNSPDNNGNLINADLANISTRKQVIELRENLYQLEKFIGQSTTVFAVYQYPQDLIKTNSNYPIFIGSPKLFALMDDTTCKTIEKEIGDKEKKKVKVRQIDFNGKIIELVRFGDIADIRVGLQTGDNDYYLFQNSEARGTYRDINQFKEFLLTEKDLEKIVNNDQLRLKVIDKGFHISHSEKNFDEDLWLGGRYIVPHDKGGESDTESGWLPNYYVPTEYYIDWSAESVKQLKSSPHARFQNSSYYFKHGITLSHTGMYSPMFRINNPTPFNVGGSCIFTIVHISNLLGIICSKIAKYLFKNGINHSVNASEDPIKEIPILLSSQKELESLVDVVIQKQKKNPRYDYMSNEQKEIDKLVYEMYGLNKEDIREVETWYARRYPKLARFCEID